MPERLRAAAQPEPFDTDLVKALMTLTPSQRAVVVLRFLEDRSVEQVASQLGKAPGTVRALTAQAMQRLRAEVPRREVEDDA